MEIDFDAIKLKIASPEEILSWSHGEVLKAETINYRTQRPEKDGLFSERIFGPTKDWECYCGKYRKIRYKGIVCDKCGVEVTRSIVRRERMGHINLAAPCSHIWFLRGVPSKMGLILDIPMSQLERVIYYAVYLVIKVDDKAKIKALEQIEQEFKSLKKGKSKKGEDDLETIYENTKKDLAKIKPGLILNESEFHNLSRKFAHLFEAVSGAEAIRKLMIQIDLEKLKKDLEKQINGIKDLVQRRRILKRLKLVKSMIASNIRPEWMILTALPILPPDLRPMVALDGGRYATSDLNDLYRRVINRNNRLKKLLELKAPEVIITNEKRMLQEAVDALIDNSVRFGTQQLSTARRPLRSLSDMLKGKQGRFRQNLLGKRVDYSGRSVIVVGPELKLNECGIPKRMALELFKPFVIQKIIDRGLAYSVRNASRLIEEASDEIWAILEEVIKDRFILLNRAPTLHRLGIQAFRPLLIEDLAIRIPAMVCTAFNADFDGDQMAVHLPLTEEAQKEAKEIMNAVHNLLKPATGDPIVMPTQDIVLGCYYLTKIKPDAKGAGRIFTEKYEALMAYNFGYLDINTPIKIRKPKSASAEELIGPEFIETSCGRLKFNGVLPPDFRFVNQQLNKKSLSKIVSEIVSDYSNEMAMATLDNIKNIGFHYATLSGITWGMTDMVTPPEKEKIIKEAEEKVKIIHSHFEEGFLTNQERRARVISVWEQAREKIEKIIPSVLDPFSSAFMIFDSGARGSWLQPTQMMGMKGIVQSPKGELIELPIRSSYKEGFSVLEYFISTHGARKGSTDTALKTASAGYLTRRLIDVAQDLIIREANCGSKKGIEVVRSEGVEYGYSFAERLFSRTSLGDIKIKGKTILKANEIIDRKAARLIEESNIQSVKVRSPITCKTRYGICSVCYGLDLGSNKPIDLGAAVGIVAAQSIGEPGTQLTLRTFHTGGIAGIDITHGLPRVEEIFEVRSPKGKAVLSEVDAKVMDIENRGTITVIKIMPKDSKKAKEYLVPSYASLFVKAGDQITKGDALSAGHIDLQELYQFKGEEVVQRYIINEIQKIYVLQGTNINDKHVEVIVRQMLARLRITDPGDSNFVPGSIMEKSKFLEENQRLKFLSKQPARAQQLLMGITKVALSTESFLSSASFQETARVLINAAAEGRIDYLRGLKENVIIGRLIPAGTGFRKNEKDLS
mgnify:CR=1 FL=1